MLKRIKRIFTVFLAVLLAIETFTMDGLMIRAEGAVWVNVAAPAPEPSPAPDPSLAEFSPNDSSSVVGNAGMPVSGTGIETIVPVVSGSIVGTVDIGTGPAIEDLPPIPPQEPEKPSEDVTILDGDFAISVSGKAYAKKRVAKFEAINAETAAALEGKDVCLAIWDIAASDADRQTLTDTEPVAKIPLMQKITSGQKLVWTVSPVDYIQKYGEYCLGAYLDSDGQENRKLLAYTGLKVSVKKVSMSATATKEFRSKAQFVTEVKKPKTALGIKKIRFDFYDKSDKLVYSCKAEKGEGIYQKTVKFRSFDYKFGDYKIKAVLTDKKGNETEIASEDNFNLLNIEPGKFIITKNNGTAVLKLKNGSVFGKIKKVEFELYKIKDGKNTGKTVIKTSGKSVYTAKTNLSEKGTYQVYAYVTMSWGEKILFGEDKFKMVKGDLGKNGWVYEKYDGKQYKVYYKNNQKVTDLTNILGLKESNQQNMNQFYIEVNRAANCVTVYAYNEEQKKYNIPVKTCTVSVGRDTWSNLGSGSLNVNTSFTPIGTYSICTNGVSPKYTLKPMYEPNGSTVYARWACHVVGNVYFHAVAVGSDSHYALSPYNYNKLGSAASAGCIRMTVADAKWLYDYASVGSVVKIVKGDSKKPGPLGKNRNITISSSIHYDPTDPAVPLSRKKADYAAGRISGYMTKNGKKVGY